METQKLKKKKNTLSMTRTHGLAILLVKGSSTQLTATLRTHETLRMQFLALELEKGAHQIFATFLALGIRMLHAIRLAIARRKLLTKSPMRFHSDTVEDKRRPNDEARAGNWSSVNLPFLRLQASTTSFSLRFA